MPGYRVEIDDAQAHGWRVTLTLPGPAAEQVLSLPVWIPGSYLVREFARHLSHLSAHQGRREVALVQRDKASWVAACRGSAALVVRYRVHAFDASVRGAFLDAERGFFNGSSLFLRAEGREAESHRVQIGRLPAGWQVATAMPSRGPRSFEAADYGELIDHPFALGRFWQGSFEAGGVEHRFVVSGAWPSFDGERLLADVQRLCSTQIRFWHGRGKPPFANYLFMLQMAEDGHGGLEHRASTALAASRRDLPRRGAGAANDRGGKMKGALIGVSNDASNGISNGISSDALSDGYLGLLGLISHEYFHAWNVKRLRPREFESLDLLRENPTELLWFFEGFTSYYDDLFLLRAGLIDRSRYLRLLAKPIAAVLGTPGRQVQSVAAASFDAWIKYYRADENTPNSTVNYYAKGALVALLCDLSLRSRSGATLDDVMRRLWSTSSGGPIGEADIADALADAGGPELRDELRDELQAWVHGTDELPLAPKLRALGVALHDEPVSLAAELGLKLSEGALSGVHVRQVLRGSAAEAAGLAPGDELLAADGWRLRRLDDARQWLRAGEPFELLLARDQRVQRRRVQPPRVPAAPGVRLAVIEEADAPTQALRRAWLGR